MKRYVVLIAMLLLGSTLMAQDGIPVDGVREGGKTYFRASDDSFQLRFDIRMYIDGAYYFDDPNDILSNGTHLRKARFAAKVKFADYWNAEWDIDVAEYEVEIKDMWVSYNKWDNAALKLGHYKVPFGLEILTSSRLIPFMERAYPALAFKMGRRTAIGYAHWGDKWYMNTALFAQSMTGDKSKSKDETGNGFAARFAVAPIKSDKMTLHLGAAFVTNKPDDEKTKVEFKAEPETKIGDIEILDAGYVTAESVQRLGVEGAFVIGSLQLQGEYQQATLIESMPGVDGVFSGAYAYASYFITGEHRVWVSDEGEFSGIKPKNKKIGAIELLARYSTLDLSDVDINAYGGKANNYTLGLNWYANQNMRYMFNYTIVDNSINATGDGSPGDYDFSYAQVRALIYF